MPRYIRDLGVTHRNMVEDIEAGYIPREYGFQIEIRTYIGLPWGSTEGRWVSFDTDGAYIVWNMPWNNLFGIPRHIKEYDLTDTEICQIEGMVDSHLDTLERELLWAEEY